MEWIGSSLSDLRSFPEDVRDSVGKALRQAQVGGKSASAKPLKGFSGAGVMEIIDDHDGDTYRAVYTVRFAGTIYVLHAFQKKSKVGISTPEKEIAVVHTRLKRAQAHYESRVRTDPAVGSVSGRAEETARRPRR